MSNGNSNLIIRAIFYPAKYTTFLHFFYTPYFRVSSKHHPRKIMPRTHGTQPSHHRRRDDEQPQDEDDSPIIGKDLEHELGDDFEENLHKTMSHEKKERTHKDHRNKLKQMINFWKEKIADLQLKLQKLAAATAPAAAVAVGSG